MNKNEWLIALALIVLTTPVTAQEDEEATWAVDAPPGDVREVSIDTTSGTWMSLDVSPDGSTIAFDLLGDIYVLPIAGGEATRIHSGLSWSWQPRYSPDGSTLAFTSDAGGGDNIWIMNADGSEPRQLTNEDFQLLNNPYWSPDGDYLAARKHFTTTRSLGAGEIWIYHRNGGGGVAVVERPDPKHQKELGEPAFSPDGRYLYFSVDSTPGGTFIYAQDTNKQIYEIRRHDLDTGVTESFVTGAGGAVRATPSPDGKYLAFVRRIRAKSALFLKDLESGAEFPIYESLDQDMQEVWGIQGLYPNMDWMPDSKSLVFWAGGGIRRIDIENREVSDIPFHVSDTRAVFDAPRPTFEVAPAEYQTTMARNAEVSPDGTRVVFETAGRLYIKDLPDGNAELLTRGNSGNFELDPSWSRDGRRIAFVSWSDASLGHVHSVRASGGRSERLTNRPGHYAGPRFSPNGESIVFEASSGGYLSSPDWSIETGVFVVDAEGGERERITRNGSNPHFGARNDRLYVTRTAAEGDGLDLVSIDLNGEAPRIHARGEYLRRYEVAPDERHLAYRENYNVYVLPLPPGGKPLTLGTEVSSFSMARASGDGGNFPHWTNGGNSLDWSLGASLFTASVDELFVLTVDDEEGPAYEPPAPHASMSLVLEADVPDTVVALTGARIVTMATDDGGVIEDGVIVVDGNRITAIGSRADVTLPAGAQVVDVSGKTIIPGLVDAHAHSPQGQGFIPQQNWSNYATLAFGVTTIFDPSNDATTVFAAADMQRAGLILAPRIYSTGDIIYGARSGYFAEINSLDDARQHVRRLKAQGAISVKNYNQPRRNQRQQVVIAAREENMLVVAEGGSLFHMDMSMVTDGNSAIEHNLPQSMLYGDVLQLWQQTNVTYTPTLGVTYGGIWGEDYWYQESDVWKHPILSRFVPPHILQPRSVRRMMAPDEDHYNVVNAATAKQLADVGVNVSIGAHGQREGLASHWDIWTFAKGGMSPVEALRTATIRPAEKIGMAADLGSLEVGKLADLVVLDVNPLEDIFQTDKVNSVMLNGRLYDAATLDETVTGDRTTQPFYWH